MADASERIIILSALLLFTIIAGSPKIENQIETQTEIFLETTTNNIIFRYGISAGKHPNELDTFRGIFKKDMVNKDPVQTELDFTREEMDEIAQRMREIGFFSYPQNYQPTIEGTIIMTRTPYSVYYLEYHGENGPRAVRWSDQYTSTKDPEFYDLNQLARLIISTIQEKPEFQKLPKPTSAYD